MSTRILIEAFDAWRDAGERMVLATVIATAGSTYSKPGAQMLISGSGQFCGLLSGGCLEGDLVEHARGVLAGGEPRNVHYDMRNRDADELWGLGLGCDGAIDIFLQALDRNHEPFACIARRIAAREPCAFALVIGGTVPDLPAGAVAIATRDHADVFSVPEQHARAIVQAGRSRLTANGSTRVQLALGNAAAEVLCVAVQMPVRLLVLGAGPDAVPLVRIARELGWYVTVGDHRPGYIERMAGAGADQTFEVLPGKLQDALDPDTFDAAVIMSHHLLSDRAYLHALSRSAVSYIGLLGPRARRERLLADLGGDAVAMQGRIHGPVGLDIGADTPQGIALSIAAEILAVLKGCRPRHPSG